MLNYINVDKDISDMALHHKLIGPPRALLALGKQLLQNRTQLISLDDWNDFRERAQIDLVTEHKIRVVIEGEVTKFKDEKSRQLIYTLATVLGTEPHKLRIARVQRGSVRVIVEVPDETLDRLASLSPIKKSLLISIGVENIEYDADASTRLSQRIERIGHQVIALSDGIADMHRTIITRFASGEQSIVAALVEKLDQSRAEIVQVLMNALESDKLQETETSMILETTHQVLGRLTERGVPQQTVQHIGDVIEDSRLSWKHRLKYAIPVIPLLLQYEGEISLDNGLNLREFWDSLVARLKNS